MNIEGFTIHGQNIAVSFEVKPSGKITVEDIDLDFLCDGDKPTMEICAVTLKQIFDVAEHTAGYLGILRNIEEDKGLGFKV